MDDSSSVHVLNAERHLGEKMAGVFFALPASLCLVLNVGKKVDTRWNARHILRYDIIRASFSELFNQCEYVGTLLEHIERLSL